MQEQFSRTELLIGKETVEKLQNAKVAIFGIGGVGSYVVEGLVRAGVQKFILVDNDEVSVSNINRQIIATSKTLGKSKVEVAKARILDINPRVNVRTYKTFFTPETSNEFDFSQYDYVNVIEKVDFASFFFISKNSKNLKSFI